MKTDHPSFKQPSNPNVKIWRYMDFTKFALMLEHAGLFFVRADFLGDPFEGSYARANEKLRPKVYKKLCDDAGTSVEEFVKAFKVVGDFVKWTRQWMMISCWHMNEFESAAMWSLYTKTNESICIQSTFHTLKTCVGDEAYVGEVQYIDYDKDWMPERNLYDPFMHKRKSFEHEREVRAIINKSPKKPLSIYDKVKEPSENGIWKKMNLDRLIKKIFVSPASPSYFSELIERILLRYNLDKEVIQSSLDEEPFF